MANPHGVKAPASWFLLCLSFGFSCTAESLVAQEFLELSEPNLPPLATASDETVTVLSGGVDLCERGDSTFRPQTLNAHQDGQTFTVDMAVRNKGDAPSGAFTVMCYLSKDTTISKLDADSPYDRNYGIAEVTMPSIAGGNSSFYQANVQFPTNIPGGTYYVGWIIDAYDDVAEDDESNNTAYRSYKLTVLGDDSGVPLLVIDDFERYTDNVGAGQAIFQTWIDGTVNGTGSQVGHLTPPYAEQTIVLAGRQSMPLQYNNSVPPYYSETTRVWPVGQNWTSANPLDRPWLQVWVRSAPKFSESGGDILLSGAGADIWGQGIRRGFPGRWRNGPTRNGVEPTRRQSPHVHLYGSDGDNRVRLWCEPFRSLCTARWRNIYEGGGYRRRPRWED